jgi:hypothetical protein
MLLDIYFQLIDNNQWNISLYGVEKIQVPFAVEFKPL